MSKPREFKNVKSISYSNSIDTWEHDSFGENSDLHLIEHQAYDSLLAEAEKMVEALRIGIRDTGSIDNIINKNNWPKCQNLAKAANIDMNEALADWEKFKDNK